MNSFFQNYSKGNFREIITLRIILKEIEKVI